LRLLSSYTSPHHSFSRNTSKYVISSSTHLPVEGIIMPNITNRILDSAQPKSSPCFIRDNRFKGFTVKVNPSGSCKFIAEAWHDGKSVRKTLGEYPLNISIALHVKELHPSHNMSRQLISSLSFKL